MPSQPEKLVIVVFSTLATLVPTALVAQDFVVPGEMARLSTYDLAMGEGLVGPANLVFEVQRTGISLADGKQVLELDQWADDLRVRKQRSDESPRVIVVLAPGDIVSVLQPAVVEAQKAKAKADIENRLELRRQLTIGFWNWTPVHTTGFRDRSGFNGFNIAANSETEAKIGWSFRGITFLR